jgi:hypothetical protein
MMDEATKHLRSEARKIEAAKQRKRRLSFVERFVLTKAGLEINPSHKMAEASKEMVRNAHQIYDEIERQSAERNTA